MVYIDGGHYPVWNVLMFQAWKEHMKPRILFFITEDWYFWSHRIDLRDHLGGALNNLRFSEQLWEYDFMAKSGFYTNRIGYPEILRIFKQAKFNVASINKQRWKRLPTPRNKMVDEFKNLTDEELAVSVFDVILKPM